MEVFGSILEDTQRIIMGDKCRLTVEKKQDIIIPRNERKTYL